MNTRVKENPARGHDMELSVVGIMEEFKKIFFPEASSWVQLPQKDCDCWYRNIFRMETFSENGEYYYSWNGKSPPFTLLLCVFYHAFWEQGAYMLKY